MSVTIYGCANLSDGTITFENLETCLEQSSCVIFEGIHAGQIALILSGADDNDCNDTFYGCWNPITGKIQIEIPEDCCEAVHWPECPCQYSNHCPSCFDTNKTPENMIIRFTGVRYCSNDELATFNDINICLSWNGKLEDAICGWGIHSGDEGCPEGISEIYYNAIGTDGISSDVMVNCGFNCCYFTSYYPLPLCLKVFENWWLKSDGWERTCSPPAISGYGGYAVITDACVLCDDAVAWVIGHYYLMNDVVIGVPEVFCYVCYNPHFSSLLNEPGVGANWENYWVIRNIS